MNAETHSGGYAPDPMPRWKRWLQQTFFPQHHLEPGGEDGNPGFAPGEAIVGVVITVDWKDRLRLLVSGSMHVEHRVRTNAPVERMQSRCQFNVRPPEGLR